MGTTRIKVIDLSSDQKQIKTARKHAEKLAMKPKKEVQKVQEGREEEKVENTPGANTGIQAGDHTGSEPVEVLVKETKPPKKEIIKNKKSILKPNGCLTANLGR